MIKVPEKHRPSPSEVVDYESNDAASLGDADGVVEHVGATTHVAADHTKHVQPELEEIGENSNRSVKTGSKVSLGRHVTSESGEKTTARRIQHVAASRKAAEASHEAQTRRVRGKDFAATIKSV